VGPPIDTKAFAYRFADALFIYLDTILGQAEQSAVFFRYSIAR